MKPLAPVTIAAFALALTACQGGFGSGDGTSAPGGMTPPINPQQQQQGVATGVPSPTPQPARASMTGKGMNAYAFADGPKGLACPSDQGFSCVLSFNLPSPSPAPSGSPGKATPTPTPTPSPTPTSTPTPFGASPSPTPTAPPQIALDVEGLPKDTPPMHNPDPKAVATTALVALRLHTDTDETLQGRAVLSYTLPKEQIGGRGFAVQLFHETVGKHNKRDDQFYGSYSDSKLSGTTLTFEMNIPQLPVKKNEIWMLVLYGDELPSSPSPSASSSASPSASPTTAANPFSSPAPSPTPTH